MKFKYSVLGLAAVLLVTLYACRKDISGNSPKSKNEVFTVDKAKSYLDSALGSTSGAVKLQSVAPNQNNSLGVIYWKYARELRSRTYQFVEIPLIIDKRATPLYDFPQDSVKIKPDVTVGAASFSRIVVYKDTVNNTIDKRIVTYIPDKAYLLRHNNDASKNWLNKLDADFSGYLEYKALDGTIQNVLRIVNGKQKAKYNVTTGTLISKSQTNNIKTNSVKENYLDCYARETSWAILTCTGDSEQQVDCVTTNTYSTYDYVCVNANDPPIGPGPTPPTPPNAPPNENYLVTGVDIKEITMLDPTRSGAGRPISPTEGFFDCFDTTLEGAVYIYVREPSAGSGNVIFWPSYPSEYDMGEVFVGLWQYIPALSKTVSRTFEFAPQTAIAPYAGNPSALSMLVDKGGAPFTVSILKYYTITSTQFADAVNYVKNGLYPTHFNLSNFNSVDFAKVIAGKVGLNSLTTDTCDVGFPPYNTPWSSPGKLGYSLRNSWVEPAGQTRVMIPGNAEATAGTCH